jgi:hypothetical protein
MTEQLVRVLWRDAHAVFDQWGTVADIDDEPCLVATVGFLVPNVKPGHVVVAQSMVLGTDDIDHVTAIPSPMVCRIDSLHRVPIIPIEPDADLEP